MKIAFYQPHLCLRGTTIGMFDYALYNQALLNNESVVIYHKEHQHNDAGVVEKFRKQFKLYEIESEKNLDETLLKENTEHVYIIKYGSKNDNKYSKVAKNLIHATGFVGLDQKHGDVFAYVSEWMNNQCANGQAEYVPHMINLPNTEEDLREELDIPRDAIVFGRTGGKDTWDIPFVTQAIYDILKKRKNTYFVFQNTNMPFVHPNIKHIPTSADPLYKVKFINTCDAFLHARSQGESFGIACGEFSSKNKPIITWWGSRERCHIEILREKGIYYMTYRDISYILENFSIDKNKNWDSYQEYTPEKVMKKFKKVFLDG